MDDPGLPNLGLAMKATMLRYCDACGIACFEPYYEARGCPLCGANKPQARDDNQSEPESDCDYCGGTRTEPVDRGFGIQHIPCRECTNIGPKLTPRQVWTARCRKCRRESVSITLDNLCWQCDVNGPDSDHDQKPSVSDAGVGV